MTFGSLRIIQMVSCEALSHDPGYWLWLPLFQTEHIATRSETLCKARGHSCILLFSKII